MRCRILSNIFHAALRCGSNTRQSQARLVRQTLLSAVAAVLFFVPLSPAIGQTYPDRPVRLVVGTNPGGGADIVARLLAARMQDQMDNPVVVENRPGASGTIAAVSVKGAAPDGHTLLFAFAAQMVMNPLVQKDIAYDPLRDFEPVSMVGILPMVLVVNPALPVQSVAELIAHAKANPGKLNYASGASSYFFVTEVFKEMTGTDMRNVPFTGGAKVVVAVLGGTVDLAFVDTAPALPQIRSGRLRALGVTTARRLASLPDVPAVAETVPGYEFVLWTAIFAPARTPKDVLAKLQHEIVRAVDAPAMREKMMAVGIVPQTGTPKELWDTVSRYTELVKKTALSTGNMVKQQ